MFDHINGMMGALAMKKTQLKEDLMLAVKVAWLKLSKYYTDVTPLTGTLLISAHILNSFQRLWLCTKWDKGMDFNPEDETLYTT